MASRTAITADMPVPDGRPSRAAARQHGDVPQVRPTHAWRSREQRARQACNVGMERMCNDERRFDRFDDVAAQLAQQRDVGHVDRHAGRFRVDDGVKRSAERHVRSNEPPASLDRHTGMEHERRHVRERHTCRAISGPSPDARARTVPATVSNTMDRSSPPGITSLRSSAIKVAAITPWPAMDG